MKRAYSAERLLPPLVSRAGVAVLVVFIVAPVLYLIELAMSPNTTVALGGTDIRHLSFHNFSDMWSATSLLQGLVNSVIIAGISAALAVILGVAAAYPLARLSFRARKPLLYSLLGSQSIPQLALLLPLYIMLAGIQGILSIHLIGSYPAIIAVYMTFGLPLATVVCFVYLRSLPRDLEDAALVDGCTRMGALRRVVAPLMAPAMVVSLVFAFLVGWNDVLFASALQNQTVAVTLEQFGLAQAEGVGAQPLYGDLMAAALVSAIPVVVLYLAFQRYLVHGLAAGALSGT
ncbi:MAG: carbohydrate ABC transporter permease [Streptosporangiaceae bacterium]|nr:carbohydrate ABC transporter permease [Streptosporangiaceae bacterium]